LRELVAFRVRNLFTHSTIGGTIAVTATPLDLNGRMAFGQSTGRPATARQVGELLELLNGAGHSDFRDARGPMGFTQRQAGGKFTADEADAFIEQLQADAERPTQEAPSAATPVVKLTAADRSLRKIPDATLAAELQRRGWIVVEP
jgi:hypothetical protein